MKSYMDLEYFPRAPPQKTPLLRSGELDVVILRKMVVDPISTPGIGGG
jgi:hypothetical protein